jgi:hypothetical protein
MTFSYTPGSGTDRDRVRFMVGDTVNLNHLVENEEIDDILSIQPVLSYAAASTADAIAAHFAREADLSIGATSISLSQKAEAYRKLADRLRKSGAGDIPGGDGTGIATLGMRVGGISRAERNNFKSDPDVIQPNFSIGQTDYPASNAVPQPDGGDFP